MGPSHLGKYFEALLQLEILANQEKKTTGLEKYLVYITLKGHEIEGILSNLGEEV